MTYSLEVKDATLSIANKILCHNLNLSIAPGEIWAILGPNGCGKTTLLHTLAGLRKTTGEIRLFAKNITSIPKQQLAKTIGILFQETRDSFPQTALELCSLGRYPHMDFFSYESENDKKIIVQSLSDMELTSLSQQNIQTLSGGERRRLSIACLLAQNPQVYLLDEPTNHLDMYYQIKILHHFKNLATTKSISVMMSLHDINLASYFCDHILMVFGQGDYLAGTTENMLHKKNLMRLYKHPVEKIMQDHLHAWIPTFENEINS